MKSSSPRSDGRTEKLSFVRNPAALEAYSSIGQEAKSRRHDPRGGRQLLLLSNEFGAVLGGGHPERKGDQYGGGVMRESALEATQELMAGSSCLGRSEEWQGLVPRSDRANP
jgi:hypothetical protein